MYHDRAGRKERPRCLGETMGKNTQTCRNFQWPEGSKEFKHLVQNVFMTGVKRDPVRSERKRVVIRGRPGSCTKVRNGKSVR